MTSFRSLALNLRHRKHMNDTQTFTQMIRSNDRHLSAVTGLKKKKRMFTRKTVPATNISSFSSTGQQVNINFTTTTSVQPAPAPAAPVRCIFFVGEEEEDNQHDTFPLLPGDTVDIISNAAAAAGISASAVREDSIADIFDESKNALDDVNVVNDVAIEAALDTNTLDCILVDNDVIIVPDSQEDVPPLGSALIADDDYVALSPSPPPSPSLIKRRKNVEEERPKLSFGHHLRKLLAERDKCSQPKIDSVFKQDNLDEWLSVKRKTCVSTKVRNKHSSVIVKDTDEECVIKTVITQTVITTYKKK